MGLRETRKQATRARVLAAARDLFEEIGYEAATIRLIATRAGVATGSVFTTFDSKKAILQAVMAERLDVLYGELSRITPHLRGPCCDRVRSIMAVHYNFEMERPRLYTAYVAISFDWSIARSPASFGGNPKLRAMLSEVMRDGIARGEVRRVLEALGLTVNRLIRLAYGPFQLGDLPIGGVEEIGPRVIREQLSQWIAPDKLPVGNATAKPVAGSVQQGRRGGVGPAVLPEAAPPKAYKPGWARPKIKPKPAPKGSKPRPKRK